MEKWVGWVMGRGRECYCDVCDGGIHEDDGAAHGRAKDLQGGGEEGGGVGRETMKWLEGGW